MKTLLDIYKLLEILIIGTSCVTRATKSSTSRVFNLKELGGGKGVRNFTVRNTGDHQLILTDNGEIIRPGEAFTILGNSRVINQDFGVDIGILDPDATGNLKEYVVRYVLDVC